MKLKLPNMYSTTAILLMAEAAALIAIALNTDRGEFVTAAFVISGMVCGISGIFVLTFSGGVPLDPRIVGILPVQGCLNLCRISSDLGITGNAHFLPGRITGQSRVMQFNPASVYDGSDISAENSFPKPGSEGILTIPSCDPLIQDLKKRNSLTIPDKEEQITQLLSEIIGDIFEFAPRLSVCLDGQYRYDYHSPVPVHKRLPGHFAGIPGLLYQESLSGMQPLRDVDCPGDRESGHP